MVLRFPLRACPFLPHGGAIFAPSGRSLIQSCSDIVEEIGAHRAGARACDVGGRSRERGVGVYGRVVR